MNNTRRLILAVWIAVYASILALGIYFGLRPLIILAVLLVLGIPPLTMHLLACSRVMRRTRVEHPDEWRGVRGPLQKKSYLFDRRDFGDAALAADKSELRWWLKAGIISIALYLPTLFTISILETKRAEQGAAANPGPAVDLKPEGG